MSNRRDFLKASIAAAAGASVGTLNFASAFSGAPPPGNSAQHATSVCNKHDMWVAAIPA